MLEWLEAMGLLMAILIGGVLVVSGFMVESILLVVIGLVMLGVAFGRIGHHTG